MSYTAGPSSGSLMTSYAIARGLARAAEDRHPGWSPHLLTNLVRHYASRDGISQRHQVHVRELCHNRVQTGARAYKVIGKRQRDRKPEPLVAAVLRCRLIASKTAGPANALFAIQWPSARAEAGRRPACGLILNPCGHYRRHQPQVQRPSS